MISIHSSTTHYSHYYTQRTLSSLCSQVLAIPLYTFSTPLLTTLLSHLSPQSSSGRSFLSLLGQHSAHLILWYLLFLLSFLHRDRSPDISASYTELLISISIQSVALKIFHSFTSLDSNPLSRLIQNISLPGDWPDLCLSHSFDTFFLYFLFPLSFSLLFSRPISLSLSLFSSHLFLLGSIISLLQQICILFLVLEIWSLHFSYRSEPKRCYKWPIVVDAQHLMVWV